MNAVNVGDPRTAATATEATADAMPAMNQAILDEVALDSLFRDIAACTRVLEVVVKTAAQRMAPQRRVTLDEAKSLLLSRVVRGVQIRYLYDGGEWWDTLMGSAEGIRIVRIRHG